MLIRFPRRFIQRSIVHRSAAATASTPASLQKLSESESNRLSKLRNIGISAHIDSGKTTLTERILFYTGRISEIHDVRGKDGVGAKMDSMELEREKGITIQSAATFTTWKDCNVNIIDTPGHVDFTIEVERALRVLDGAVLVLCSVGGVQSQTSTVDRQMKRYKVPRISFINKMDRMGANPFRVIEQMRKKLRIGVAAVQIPIGSENDFRGVVDLVRMKAVYNDGLKGVNIREEDIPSDLLDYAKQRRNELIQVLADYDDEIAEYFLNEEEPSAEVLKAGIRRATLGLNFTPVFMGSAYKNTCVQPLLDGVLDYLPDPSERENHALDLDNKEAPIALLSDKSLSSVALAFKLEDTKYGQLTYIRVYQGSLKRGMTVVNMRNPGKKIKLSKIVRMHSNEMEEVEELPAGEIGAVFGIECASGDSFTDGSVNFGMTSMFVPDPVVSLSLKPKSKDSLPNFSKALQKFMREDPTFRVHKDPESNETVISGMGELHLEIYVERMKREYNCECITGKPQVAYRETISRKAKFDYTHKKQSGGAGQYGKIIGYMEPIKMEDSPEKFVMENEFVDKTVGLNIPSQYIPSVEKGFYEACEKGKLIGHKVVGVRFVLEDGASHSVDSSDLAFRQAATGAFRQASTESNPIVLEPIMSVSVTTPQEFQSSVMSQLNKRKGSIVDSDVNDGFAIIQAHVPLTQMFGYVGDLRSATQGKGEYTMEYKSHEPLMRNEQEDMVKAYQNQQQSSTKK